VDELRERQRLAHRRELRRRLARVGDAHPAPRAAAHRAIAKPDSPSPATSALRPFRSNSCSWAGSGVLSVAIGLVSRPRPQRSFSVDRPNSTSIIVTIQKRTTTWLSLTPPTSKWWCSGAILKMRRPSP